MTTVSTPRRFSYGGPEADLVGRTVWKFDVVLPAGGVEMRRTGYVKRPTRGTSLETLFAHYPRAKVYGTGYPLRDEHVGLAIGRQLADGEVYLVDDLGETPD